MLTITGVVVVFILVRLVLVAVAGRASRNVATRPVVDRRSARPLDASPGGALSSACYIEAPASAERRAVSCSFVEFDERGDYLDFEQHRHAYETIMRLVKADPPVTIVILFTFTVVSEIFLTTICPSRENPNFTFVKSSVSLLVVIRS